MIQITAIPGQRITVHLSDCTFVGQLDSIDDVYLVISGTRIRRDDVRDIDVPQDVVSDDDYCSDCGHFHQSWSCCPESSDPCGDYRCCQS